MNSFQKMSVREWRFVRKARLASLKLLSKIIVHNVDVISVLKTFCERFGPPEICSRDDDISMLAVLRSSCLAHDGASNASHGIGRFKSAVCIVVEFYESRAKHAFCSSPHFDSQHTSHCSVDDNDV